MQRTLLYSIFFFGFFFFGPLPEEAQAEETDFYHRWTTRTTRLQSAQPGWAIPMFSPYTNIVQAFRQDFTYQRNSSSGETSWALGSGKGFNLIPFARTQFDINLPAYVLESANSSRDGFRDMSLGLKYELLTGNEKHGNYTVTVGAAGSFTNGSKVHGSSANILTPSFGVGKGFGNLVIQSTFGIGLPLAHTRTLGRHVTWNTVAQYRLKSYLWPEVEANTTFYQGTAADGEVQNFVSPGLVLGKFKFHPHTPTDMLGLVFGAGVQIATTEYYRQNHATNFSVRFNF